MLLDSAGQDESDCLPRRKRLPAKAKPTTFQGETDELSGPVRNRRLTFSLYHGDGTIVQW